MFLEQSIMDWIINNWLEIFGVITAFLFLYLEIKEKISMWPVGIVTSAVYVIVFFKAGFYADTVLSVYYIAMGIYGWFVWSQKDNSSNITVSKMDKKHMTISIVSFALLYTVLYFILSNYTDSVVPIGDSFTTALSFVATWLLTRKILEQWHLWFVANFVSMALYIHKGLYPTAILFLFYTTMSIVGYLQWKKNMLSLANDK